MSSSIWVFKFRRPGRKKQCKFYLNIKHVPASQRACLNISNDDAHMLTKSLCIMITSYSKILFNACTSGSPSNQNNSRQNMQEIVFQSSENEKFSRRSMSPDSSRTFVALLLNRRLPNF